MRFRSGMIFAVAAGVVLGGCAAGAVGGGGPVTSPTGEVYEPGIEPTQTQFSRDATLALAQGQFEEALGQARQGMAADSTNPIHYYLGGDAAVGMGDFALADSLWQEAERLYPAYELDIEPSRETAWANAFNEGVEAYNAGDVAGAIQHWSDADTIYRLRPEAAQNLGVLLMQEGEYDRAAEVFRRGIESIDMLPATRVIEEEEMADREAARLEMQQNLVQLLLYTDQYAEAEPVLRQVIAANPDDVGSQASLATALMRQGREDEANEIYARLLAMPDLAASDLFEIGVALFDAEDYLQAAEAFGRVTEVQPESRDAWFNQANALYAAEEWEGVIPIAERLLEIDPLNSDAALILAQSYRESGQNQEALLALQRLESLPVLIADPQLQPGAAESEITGQVVGNAAEAGTPIQLRFTFYDDGGQVGTSTITVNAPERESRENFTVTVPAQANAYSYEVL